MHNTYLREKTTDRVDTADRARAEMAGRVNTTPLSPSARLLRLSSRYMTARREGRTQAANAINRMAKRIMASIPA